MATVVSNRGAEGKIKQRQEFVNTDRTWSGRKGGADSLGNLPPAYHASAQAAFYVVYSYRTPIGWINMHGNPEVPDVGYSDTTSQHQYGTANAWNYPYRPQRGRPLAPSGGGPRRGGIDSR